MAIDTLKNVNIRGIACCVPEDIIDIREYYNVLGKEEVDKFIKTTGVKQKHCNKSSRVITASDLCFHAASKLIKELNVDKSTIDALIFVTQSSDYIQPATACVLQYRLGLSNNCISYDINLGCSGYVYGLHIASLYLQKGNIKRVLLLTGEADANISPINSLLFGEAGSATLLDYDNNSNDIKFMLKTIGSGYKQLIYPYGGYRHGIGDNNNYIKKSNSGISHFIGMMDGPDVFNFTIKEVPKLFKEYYQEFDYTNDDFDLFVLHQANLFMIEYIAKKLKIPNEKLPISIDRYGNTSSASIPITICNNLSTNKDKVMDKRIKIIASGFGIGLSLGVVSFEIDSSCCFPIITTNIGFEDEIL